MPAGRPSKRTNENRNIILTMLAKIPVPKIACAAAGLSLETYERWYRTDPEFRAKIEQVIGVEKSELYQKVKDKEPWKLLKSIGREHFNDEETINVNDVKAPDLSDVPAGEILAKLRKA
ncbi:MAG: hypothetical protein IPI28_18990 [Candidatus Omnitrophica bacterium]|nr:hypothetical protein [Candidatus Omnitrophota bacterium]